MALGPAAKLRTKNLLVTVRGFGMRRAQEGEPGRRGRAAAPELDSTLTQGSPPPWETTSTSWCFYDGMALKSLYPRKEGLLWLHWHILDLLELDSLQGTQGGGRGMGGMTSRRAVAPS